MTAAKQGQDHTTREQNSEDTMKIGGGNNGRINCQCGRTVRLGLQHNAKMLNYNWTIVETIHQCRLSIVKIYYPAESFGQPARDTV